MTRSNDPRRLTTGSRPAVGAGTGSNPPAGGNPGRPAGPPTAKAHELVAMAHALCDEGRAREAEDMARWALSQAPQLAGAQTVLARARFEQGHLREAQALLESVVLRHPAFFTAHRWLAEVLVRLGDWPHASEILVRAEALSPRDPRIGQLVQQVMASPGRSGPNEPPAGFAQVPPPPVAPNPLPPNILPTGARLRTYEEQPAVTADMPGSMVRSPAVGLVPRNTRISSSPPENNTPTRGERSKSARQARQPRPTRAAPRLRTGMSWAPVSRWFLLYRRFFVLGAIGVGLFVLTVMSVSWFLRQPRTEHVERVADRMADQAATPLSPVLSGTYKELATIRARDRRRQARLESEPTGRALLAEALLASEYGRTLDPDSESWADELAESHGGLGGPEELLAARVLDRLVRGDRAGAGELARTRGLSSSDSPLLRFVDARRLERDGNLAAALARAGAEAATSPFLPLRLLRAELLLDQGNPAGALELVSGVLVEAPAHTGALRLLLEARDGLGSELTTREKADVKSACAAALRGIPTLAAACRLHEGVLQRRLGKRREAVREALAAAHLAPDDPRLLAMIAQLLGNLGVGEEATELVERAETLADRQFPPLAWARAGVGVGRDRATPVPAGSPPGPEARLIAVRSVFAGPPGRKRSLGTMGVTAALTKGDGDLRWVASGAEARNRGAIEALTRRAESQYGRKLPSPVASYVVGTLARRLGRKPLAASLLSQALDGHGDACRSASLYRMSLRDTGQDPLRNVRLQRAIGRLGCDQKLGSASR
jgi:tetratricopeptide (TPR) repeat protein